MLTERVLAKKGELITNGGKRKLHLKVSVLIYSHYLPIVLLTLSLNDLCESHWISESLDLNCGLLPLTFEEGFAIYEITFILLLHLY